MTRSLAELAAVEAADLTPLENADYVLELEEAVRASVEAEAYRRAWRCFLLAPDIETYEALLRGERVPVSRLDPKALRRTRPL